jgi:hypothetical protein
MTYEFDTLRFFEILEETDAMMFFKFIKETEEVIRGAEAWFEASVSYGPRPPSSLRLPSLTPRVPVCSVRFVDQEVEGAG